MTVGSPSWENSLLTLANQAWPAHITDSIKPVHETELVMRAYKHCRSLTAYHSKSFYLASRLLPEGKKEAVWALYAFCRTSDDIVDCIEEGASTKSVEECWDKWRQTALSSEPSTDDLVAVAWAETRRRFHIPYCYAEQLIQGIARDLHQNRYATFTELAHYAYGVASTVGLMSMHIIGYAGWDAIPYAVKLGVALQLTNILRDVGEDWDRGRIYLPEDELEIFNLSERNIAEGIVDERWRVFMRFQIERNRRLYREAQPGIQLLDPDGRLAIQAASDIYSLILDEIEAHDYDVFNRRAMVSGYQKLYALPCIWWRARRSINFSGKE